MNIFKSLFNLFFSKKDPEQTPDPNTEGSKNKLIAIISPNKGDGKTSLIEAVFGHDLQWRDCDIVSDKLEGSIQCADVEYNGSTVTIMELSIVA